MLRKSNRGKLRLLSRWPSHGPTLGSHPRHRDNFKRDAPVAQLDRVSPRRPSEALGYKFPATAGCRAYHRLKMPFVCVVI